MTDNRSPEPVAAILQLVDEYWCQAWNEARKGRPFAERSREERLVIREQIETQLHALAHPELQVDDAQASN